MEIIKAYLNKGQCNFNTILKESTLFEITKEEASQELFSQKQDTLLQDEEKVLVFQKVGTEKNIEKFCYLIYKNILGKDDSTTMFVIDKIIIDNNAIDIEILSRIFEILFQQDYGMYDRIQVGKINERIAFNKSQLPRCIAKYLVDACNCYNMSDHIVLTESFP